jgi:seryl-tRNA synthetase
MSGFRDELLRHGLLIATSVCGVYGRSGELEDTIQRVDGLASDVGADDRPDVMRFPPALTRADFERSGYLESFPHLAGVVQSFSGGERAHRELLRAAADGDNWSATFPPAEIVLTPAACYPVYPTLTGTLPQNGRLIDVMSYCFRHEPSADPARMQMFRMHEHVRAADRDAVVAWRECWLDRLTRFVETLALDAHAVVASDPFFGRAGTLLADSQRDRRLKLEVVAPIATDDCPTAIISLNYHQDHFGERFEIRTATGEVAHTACVGFGLERIALALYRRHGLARARWPSPVREALGL